MSENKKTVNLARSIASKTLSIVDSFITDLDSVDARRVSEARDAIAVMVMDEVSNNQAQA